MNSGDERGSVLALVPAGFLVLILLAALAVDSAVTYLGQQQLHDTLAAAATDSATAAIDNGSFYRSGSVVLDPAQVARTMCLSLGAQNQSGLHNLRVWLAVDGNQVAVEGTATVNAVFGRIVPGLARRRVRARVSAVATNGPVRTELTAPTPLVPLSC
jgi:hypothetical protein